VVLLLRFIDVWTNTAERKTFTHYTKRVRPASIERICQPTQSKKLGIETLLAAFKDHLAACVRPRRYERTHRGQGL